MKAVLVIDEMPKNCDMCPLQRWGIDGWNCTPKNEVIEDDKPSWCPLVPMDAYDMLRDELKKRMEHPERYAKR